MMKPLPAPRCGTKRSLSSGPWTSPPGVRRYRRGSDGSATSDVALMLTTVSSTRAAISEKSTPPGAATTGRASGATARAASTGARVTTVCSGAVAGASWPDTTSPSRNATAAASPTVTIRNRRGIVVSPL